jgi:hypothetical protein
LPAMGKAPATRKRMGLDILDREFQAAVLQAEAIVKDYNDSHGRPTARRPKNFESVMMGKPPFAAAGGGSPAKPPLPNKRDSDAPQSQASKKQKQKQDPSGVATATVASLASQCSPCQLVPKQFFVAWSGVVTLAWSGFPPQLAELKRAIAETFPDLPDENPGSRWAKTTLGCLRDGKRLTPDTLKTLARVCDEFRKQLRDGDGDGDGNGDGEATWEPPPHPGCVPVDALSVIVYQCRSLEKVLSEHVVNLCTMEYEKRPPPPPWKPGGGTRWAYKCAPDLVGKKRSLHPPSEDELHAVDSVVAQFSGPDMANEYFHDAARCGSRETRYRGTHAGVTLTARVGKHLPPAVGAFRDAVDKALPGLYVWFEDSSLHCTVRGLVN